VTRLYQNIPLAPQTTIQLDAKASHHLARVLRAQVGDALVVFNGAGGEYPAVITHIDKKSVQVKLQDFSAREVESHLQIQLAQGIARGEKMDFIVQKAVELGVARITPLVTVRCNVRLKDERADKRQQHWQAVITSACEQSGRNRLPTLDAVTDFRDWVSNIQADYKFVLSPHVDKKLALTTIPADSRIVLLIGSEGGLSDEEVAMAIEHGFDPLNLGQRILRTETATIAALAALQARFGDFCD
jgi:16S rRNA (uracil1498-N3)-methyltransferase